MPGQVVVGLPVVERPVDRAARRSSARPGSAASRARTGGRRPSAPSRRGSRAGRASPGVLVRQLPVRAAVAGRADAERPGRAPRGPGAGAAPARRDVGPVGALVEVAVVGDLVAGVADRPADRRPPLGRVARDEERRPDRRPIEQPQDPRRPRSAGRTPGGSSRRASRPLSGCSKRIGLSASSVEREAGRRPDAVRPAEAGRRRRSASPPGRSSLAGRSTGASRDAGARRATASRRRGSRPGSRSGRPGRRPGSPRRRRSRRSRCRSGPHDRERVVRRRPARPRASRCPGANAGSTTSMSKLMKAGRSPTRSRIAAATAAGPSRQDVLGRQVLEAELGPQARPVARAS